MNSARILIVEDQSIIALDLSDRLLNLGYVITGVVSSGEAVVQQAGQLRPDLILMDIRLQGEMDGIQAAAQIQRALDLPVIFLTAYSDDRTLQRARLIEPYSYVLKPFEDRELQVAIELAVYKHQMEAKLKENERWLASALTSIGDAVIATDSQGLIKFMNPKAEALTGWPQVEVAGRPLSQVFKIVNAETGAPAPNPVTRLLQVGQTGGLAKRTVLVARDENEIPIDERAAPIRDAHGYITGVVLTFHDITERWRAEEERRLLEIMAAAADGAESLPGLLEILLRTICAEMKWVAAEAWYPRADGAVLECSPLWHNPTPRLDNFHAASLRLTCAPGVGLPGRVWATAQPVWVPALALDPQFERAALARAAGFAAALGIPILARGEVLAVAVFFALEPRPRDQRRQAVVTAVAAQFGPVIERKLAQSARQESEARYRAIVQDQTELICRTLPDGRLTFVNDAYCRYFNQTAEALLGRRFQPPIYAEDLEVVTSKRAALRLQAPTVTYWHRLALADGQMRWQQWTDRALFNEQGAVVEIQSVGQDITARKRAELALKQRNEELLALNAIATAISHAPDINRLVGDVLHEILNLLAVDGVCVCLPDETSAAPPRLLAAQRETLPDITAQLQAKPWPAGQAPDQAAVLMAQVFDRLAASGWDVGPGSVGVPIASQDKMLGVLCLVRRGPNKLSHHERQILATISHQIAVAVQNVRLTEQTVEIEILRELDRLRSELIANVSHELRTPLGLILLACTTLLQPDLHLDQATQREFLADIQAESHRLEHIIVNLLNLSRMQSGRLNLDRQPTDMAHLVQAALASVRAALTAHRLVYDFPKPALIAFADSERVEQILRNLVGNAIKYSPAGGKITIRGRRTATEIVIEVSDHGIGIPPPDLRRVFERFYRVPNATTQQVDGAGLGLAVCQGTVEAHGGRIWVESTLGAGSTFYFTLPAADAMPAVADEGPPA